MGKNLKVLFVSAEVAPYAKTGGLADVAGSLPEVLSGMGIDIRVVFPGYRGIDAEQEYVADFPVTIGNRLETCILKRIKDAPVTTYTVNNYCYYYRDGIYMHHDDGERFSFLCRASLDLCRAIGFKPDIIHMNDWHSGPVALLLKEQYKQRDSFFSNIKTVLTIHNLEYQGHFEKDILFLLGLPEELFTPEGVEFYGKFNFLKAGILYADKINTVSPTYSEEILTPEYGEGLEGVLFNRRKDLCGILNGISHSQFNPETDVYLKYGYNEENLSGKRRNKSLLQAELGLPVENVPVVGVVHRLVLQKGLDLVIKAFDKMMELGIQFILLGTGDPNLEKCFVSLMHKYPRQVAVRIEFNEELAHKIYSGSDIFLMPSRFEPCGLGQMISLRYGTIPLVRETGGLKDTVIDIGRDLTRGNGFTFSEYTPYAFLGALQRAVEVYRNKPGLWLAMVKRGLKTDFSWENSAKQYLNIYNSALRE
ncbi:glycogen synthase GlgA [Thermoclostridium stercorarium]|jgi:starch synthase|uniref:Glycogen synthase n=1 Tax=Thermoclostridium stercorarium subsp. leptospartum DSM 9219 TaxID=1346611 RepID=A0A1B1YMR4_THEST|nr:glycogen synthase GlgA [Thermoclostridium stercorarium]ANX02077.1 starch synthase [Thermoclostridium stercorarium subsp. leptospartum DSM 9219]UZQ85137.1 glycogen synthase GlgA [Thermoclostridium stercorarium]